MKLQDRLTANAHWLLRLAIVGVFVYHGVLKFSNLDGFATMLPISYTQVVFVALANIGSVLVILGGFRNDWLSDLATRIGWIRGLARSRPARTTLPPRCAAGPRGRPPPPGRFPPAPR